jgi:3-hydroxy-9,10-secoandrosta-1,3,5(10)-triene-9,17-dione monooxygenase
MGRPRGRVLLLARSQYALADADGVTNAMSAAFDPPMSAADLLARARALVPNLATRIPAATTARKIPDETIAEYRQTGILRVLQPRRFGGFQASFGLFVQIVEALTEGCASSAWVYAVLAELQWVIALLPERGQDDIWGTAPEAVAAGSLVPRATGRRCDGGWRISGRYPFASGCMHAQWAIIGARCEDAAGNEQPRYLTVPMGELEIVDDWQALGMRGTGSRSLVLHDVFVPEHRTIALRDVLDGTPPGLLVHPDYPLLRAPRYYLVPFVLPAVAFALARHALPQVATALRARDLPPSEVLHLQLGKAAAQIETANLIVATRREESVARLEAGTAITESDVLRNRRDVTLAFQLLRRGVEQLVAISGARTVYDGEWLQSVLRDITTISTHVVLNEQAAMVPFGRMLLAGGARG